MVYLLLVFTALPLQVHEIMSFETVLLLISMYHSLNAISRDTILQKCLQYILESLDSKSELTTAQLAKCRLALLLTCTSPKDFQLNPLDLLRQTRCPANLLLLLEQNILKRPISTSNASQVQQTSPSFA